ncbi:MAG: NADAR family protein [Oscillospiraceae bacterium]|nr:NADAR family protein [Oscillospiraceae bacterium]
MKYNKNDLILSVKNGRETQYIFFWGHTPDKGGKIKKSCLSQWYKCTFTVEGTVYHTAEQYMMAQKALLFGDKEIFSRIMQAKEPDEYKKLGRMIRGFDEKIWAQNRCNIVIAGNTAKFSQNDDLKSFLVSTGEKVLVEASPYDNLWGIGINASDDDCNDPEKWPGENLLGFCLMEARDNLK